MVAFNRPGHARPGSVGQLLDWVEAKAVDDAGRSLAGGSEGELWLRGECVAAGYHARPEETAAAFTPEGWLKTGDVARIDADGYLWITGRKKDLIISAGENIAPGEIESILRQHPDVCEAAVVGVPHATRGEAPKAFCSLRPGAAVGARDLARFCRARLPRHKVPVATEIRDELPHGPTGKIDRRALRELAAEAPCPE